MSFHIRAAQLAMEPAMFYNKVWAVFAAATLSLCQNVNLYGVQATTPFKDISDVVPAFRLETVKSVTFKAELSYDYEEGNETQFMPGQDFLVQAQRPGSLHITAITAPSKYKDARGIRVVPYSDFISDGKKQLEIAPFAHFYIQNSAASALDKVFGAQGMFLYIHTDLLFARHVASTFALKYDGIMNVKGTETVMFKTAVIQPTHEQYVTYLARQTGLPLRVSIFHQDKQGRMHETVRTDYSDWKLDVDLPAATFDTTPPPGFVLDSLDAPKYDAKWKPGVLPVSFKAKTLNGDTVILDKYKGQVVLLDYWASWCGPCVEEMPSTLAAYQRLHKQGLEIVGISLDTPDQRERMDKYLRQNPLPWPQICDGGGFKSPLAKAYAVDAIPFNLLIGRDGKIAAVDVHGKALEDAIVHALSTK